MLWCPSGFVLLGEGGFSVVFTVWIAPFIGGLVVRTWLQFMMSGSLCSGCTFFVWGGVLGFFFSQFGLLLLFEVWWLEVWVAIQDYRFYLLWVCNLFWVQS